MQSRLFDIVESGYERHATGIQLVTKRNGVWIETSTDDFKRMVHHAALGFYDLGLRKGDRVAIHSENNTEWILVDQALMTIGAVPVPIYTTLPTDQIAYIVRSCEAAAYVVSGPELYEAFEPEREQLSFVKHVVYTVNPVKGASGLQQLIDRGAELAAEHPGMWEYLKSEVTPDDLATLIYTSGTTGFPKGVMITHGNLSFTINVGIERIPFALEDKADKAVLAYLPLSHIFERAIDLVYMKYGYTIYYVEKMEEIPQDLKHVKPYFFGSVPRLLEKMHTAFRTKVNEAGGLKKALGNWALDMAENQDVGQTRGFAGRVKYAIADILVYRKLRDVLGGELMGMVSGGAALSPKLLNFYNGIGLLLLQGYGLSETAPLLTLCEKGDMRQGSVGKTIRGVELKIAEDGEIIARGPNIMKGYWNQPAETAEVMTSDGWFHTGDIGVMDADGYVFITDRKKDLFKLSTGKYVAPAHIETSLMMSPLIDHAAVLGSHQKFCSALIVPNQLSLKKALNAKGELDIEKAEALIQVVVDQVNEKLPPWEKIKKFALLDAEFSIQTGELTPSMKLKRRVIHEKFSDRIARIYESES
jgi:long-chain acyl-CoA synthetase